MVGVKNDRKIPNSSMTASSWKPGYYPYAARLDKSIGSGSWCAANNKKGEYLQVDLGEQLTILKLAIQGDSINSFGVTHFSIAYSQNGVFWVDYTEGGYIKVRAHKVHSATLLLNEEKDECFHVVHSFPSLPDVTLVKHKTKEILLLRLKGQQEARYGIP